MTCRAIKTAHIAGSAVAGSVFTLRLPQVASFYHCRGIPGVSQNGQATPWQGCAVLLSPLACSSAKINIGGFAAAMKNIFFFYSHRLASGLIGHSRPDWDTPGISTRGGGKRE